MSQPRYAIGIHLGEATVVVDLRGGRILARKNGSTKSADIRSLIDDAKISDDQIAAIGLAGESDAQIKTMRESLALSFTREVLIVATRPEWAAVPGAGVASPSTVVLWMSKDQIRPVMNSRIEASVAGIESAPDMILPGYFGYAMPAIPFLPNEVESTALRLREVFDSLESAGVHVRRFVVAGDQATSSPPFLQMLADVLAARIKIAASDIPAAVGAAILAGIHFGIEASGHASMSRLIHAIAQQRQDLVYRPDLASRKKYVR